MDGSSGYSSGPCSPRARVSRSSRRRAIRSRWRGSGSALACSRHPRLRPTGRPPHPPHTLRHYGAKHGSLTTPVAKCGAIARGSNRMLLSPPAAFREERNVREDGRSGSACAGGKARTLRTPASRRHRPLSARSRTPRDLASSARQAGPSVGLASLAQVELETGAGLPEFVEFVKEEFDAFLECGIPSFRWGRLWPTASCACVAPSAPMREPLKIVVKAYTAAACYKGFHYPGRFWSSIRDLDRPF